jgi:hypothetical protein
MGLIDNGALGCDNSPQRPTRAHGRMTLHHLPTECTASNGDGCGMAMWRLRESAHEFKEDNP